MTEWRTIPSYPDYEASDEGQIRRIRSAHFKNVIFAALTPYIGKRGNYLRVGIWEGGRTKSGYVHILVCEAFHGLRPLKHDAAHWDGDKNNNTPDNLRWATRSENERDKQRHGLSNRGERNGQSLVTDTQVVEIREKWAKLPRSSDRGCRVKKGATAQLLAEYGISYACLYAIITRKHWGHI